MVSELDKAEEQLTYAINTESDQYSYHMELGIYIRVYIYRYFIRYTDIYTYLHVLDLVEFRLYTFLYMYAM
jgi:hypothetical protein